MIRNQVSELEPPMGKNPVMVRVCDNAQAKLLCLFYPAVLPYFQG